MSTQKLDPQITKWISIVVVEGLVAAVLALFVIMPQMNSINEAQARLGSQLKVLTNLRDKSDLLTNFSFQFAQKDELINQILPGTKDVGLALASIRQVAVAQGVDIIGYSLNPGEILNSADIAKAPANSSPYINMELTIKTPPANLQKFLYGVDNSLPLKSVENLEVTRSVSSSAQTGETSQSLEAKVTIHTYYLPPIDIRTPAGSLSPFSKDLQSAMNVTANYTRVNLGTNAGTTSAVPLGNNNLFGL